jgi:hypothetical protein
LYGVAFAPEVGLGPIQVIEGQLAIAACLVTPRQLYFEQASLYIRARAGKESGHTPVAFQRGEMILRTEIEIAKIKEPGYLVAIYRRDSAGGR